jgi:asparagine synthase (glutamine-hydrolysing)
MPDDTLKLDDLLPDSDPSKIRRLISELDSLARSAVRRAITDGTEIAFSGGIDSSILAVLASTNGSRASLWTVGVEGSVDTRESMPDFPDLLRFSKIVTRERVRHATQETVKLVNVSTVSHLEDCVAFYLIADELKRSGWKGSTIASANGPDELFCGYDRFRRILDVHGYSSVELEIASALQAAGLLRTKIGTVLNEFGLKSVEPFFDERFVRFCTESIPIEAKITKGEDRLRKRVWRLYGRMLGLPDQIVLRPKKAMQYSMGLHSIVLKMIRHGEIKLAE